MPEQDGNSVFRRAGRAWGDMVNLTDSVGIARQSVGGQVAGMGCLEGGGGDVNSALRVGRGLQRCTWHLVREGEGGFETAFYP